MRNDQVKYITVEDATAIVIEAYEGFGFVESRFFSFDFSNMYCPLKTVSMETLSLFLQE